MALACTAYAVRALISTHAQDSNVRMSAAETESEIQLQLQ